MENEVSGIAKLGIVLIALAVLIGLGFGIFQISKGTANTGVNNVQSELDNVAVSTFSNYDQTVIGGSMARAATTDFEGKETAILIATQAWVNAMHDTFTASTPANKAVATNLRNITVSNKESTYVVGANDDNSAADTTSSVVFKGSGFSEYRGTIVPVVNAFADKNYTTWYEVSTTANVKSTTGTPASGDDPSTGYFPANFINYNALLGDTINVQGVNNQNIYINKKGTNDAKAMANIYFDKNCFRCETGFLTSDNGRVQYNNIIGNLQKTGTTEYIPNGAKFESFLIKDTSGTTIGVALRQINNV